MPFLFPPFFLPYAITSPFAFWFSLALKSSHSQLWSKLSLAPGLLKQRPPLNMASALQSISHAPCSAGALDKIHKFAFYFLFLDFAFLTISASALRPPPLPETTELTRPIAQAAIGTLREPDAKYAPCPLR
tara:strand:- start:2853 stop:3245 length:393 start_codon:yes stop_codon:yes gene_type:complete